VATLVYKVEEALLIALGASTSGSIELPGRQGVIGIVSPAVVTGLVGSPSGDVSLRILGSIDGVSFFPIYDRATGVPVTLALGLSEARVLPIDPIYTAMCTDIKVQIVNPSALNVGINQAAARTFVAVLYEV